MVWLGRWDRFATRVRYVEQPQTLGTCNNHHVLETKIVTFHGCTRHDVCCH